MRCNNEYVRSYSLNSRYRLTIFSDESMLAAGSDNSENEPKILIGEQVINYPFTDTTYLYAPRIFMGKVIFEKKCPTEAPSISIAPSFAPSNVASER